jgi:hypothetical protein
MLGVWHLRHGWSPMWVCLSIGVVWYSVAYRIQGAPWFWQWSKLYEYARQGGFTFTGIARAVEVASIVMFLAAAVCLVVTVH